MVARHDLDSTIATPLNQYIQKRVLFEHIRDGRLRWATTCHPKRDGEPGQQSLQFIEPRRKGSVDDPFRKSQMLKSELDILLSNSGTTPWINARARSRNRGRCCTLWSWAFASNRNAIRRNGKVEIVDVLTRCCLVCLRRSEDAGNRREQRTAGRQREPGLHPGRGKKNCDFPSRSNDPHRNGLTSAVAAKRIRPFPISLPPEKSSHLLQQFAVLFRNPFRWRLRKRSAK